MYSAYANIYVLYNTMPYAILYAYYNLEFVSGISGSDEN